MTEKSYLSHLQTDKHFKTERRSYRSKIIKKANEKGKEVSNKDTDQKIDKRFPELEGIKYCESCNMYPDNNTAYNKHVEPSKHRNNVRAIDGDLIKNGV